MKLRVKKRKLFISPWLELSVMVVTVLLSYIALILISRGSAIPHGGMALTSITWLLFGFFLLSFAIAIIAVLAGIGGGVIYTPIMLALTPVNSLIVRATKHSETDSERRRLERWKEMHADLINYVHERQLELWGGDEEIAELEEDVITEEMLEDIEYLSRDEYKVEEILNDTILDLDQIALFLEELHKFQPANDDKLQALIKLLRTDPVLKTNKVIIFSEFADTARYLKKQLIRDIKSITRRKFTVEEKIRIVMEGFRRLWV
jgi:hypothetical protein